MKSGSISRRNLLLSTLLLAGGQQGCKPPPKTVQAAPAGPFLFSDQAQQAGLSFDWSHHGRSPLTILDTAGYGCAFLDYDADGLLDILLVGQPHCKLYRNMGNGTFEDVTRQAGLQAEGFFMGAAVGDYNNDGYPDLFLTGYGCCALFENRRGVFHNVTAQAGLQPSSRYAWSTSAVWTDLNNDGRLDLAVGHYVTFTPATLQTCAYSGVQAACPPFYYEPQFLSVYHNSGSYPFHEATEQWGFSKNRHGNTLGIAAASYDESGLPSLYCANDGLPADLWHAHNHLYENLSSISGVALDRNGNPQAGMGADWGDYDNDGRLDLIVATFQDQARALYHNEGGGQFSYASWAAGLGAATLNRLAFSALWADFNGDGRLDLMFTNGHVQDTIHRFRPPATYRQPMQCFCNTGSGHFTDVTAQCGDPLQRPIVGRGMAVGDYDNDGRPDLLVVNLEGGPLLLHNDSPGQNWLGIRLTGTRSNRDAIGAQVTLEADGLQQMREVQTGRGYLSSSDPRLLFGLGRAQSVQSLQVRWPSGLTEHLAPPAINRYYTLQEGSGRLK